MVFSPGSNGPHAAEMEKDHFVVTDSVCTMRDHSDQIAECICGLADSRLPISPERTHSNIERHANLQTSVSCLRRESVADDVIQRQNKRGYLRLSGL